MEVSREKLSKIQIVFVCLMNINCLNLFGSVFCHGPATPLDEPELVKFKSCLADTKVDVSDPSNETWWYDSQSAFISVLKHPTAIAYAESTSQVQELVKCATKHGVKINPRSGGDSYEAFCNEDHSLVIDVSRIASVNTNEKDRTATVGAGIRLGRLYYELGKHRMTFPSGIHHTVGLGGHVAAGGYGYLTRLWGMSADNVLELEMVDFRGDVLVANNGTNEDLFFALRGGGGGSYGIVTQMKLRIYPNPPLSTAFTVHWKQPIPASDFSKAWFEWKPWKSVPREMTFIMFYSKTSFLSGIHVGDDGHSGVEQILSESGFLRLGPEASQKYECYSSEDLLETRAWLDNGNVHYGNESDYQMYNVATSHIFRRLNLPPFPVPVHPAWTPIQNDTRVNATHSKKSVGSVGQIPHLETLFVDREYQKDSSQVFVKEFDQVAYDAMDEFVSNPGCAIVFNSLGGISSTTSEDFNAFPHRDEPFLTEYMIPYHSSTDSRSGVVKQTSILHTILDAMEPYTNHRSYQGAPDLSWTTDPRIYMPRYYGDNVDRLVRAKTTYDPLDFFSNAQSTPSHFKSTKPL